ncbi:MAG: PD40 domain-containing protein, partial [Bacteroidia bacterium]|nr:PD40 domain-containing protein [Bacteroidia bacterium]
MHRNLRFYLFLTALLFTNFIWGQKSLIKAERQFELKAFDLAIENAKKALDKDPECIECQYIIAESFRMMNENVDAAHWYSKMETSADLPREFAFNYGLLLKRMGEYRKAKEYFDDYRIVDPVKAELFSNSCDFAIRTLSSEKEFEVNLYAPSSRNTDFGPTIFGDKVVFCSFRTDFQRGLDIPSGLSKIQDDKCQLYISDMGMSGDLGTTDFLLPAKDETFDMGPIHYASDAPVVAVTKNNFRDGEKQIFSNDLELSLFLAEVQSDGSFKKLKAFPYNEVGYATGFGTLNPTGKILYFASNRPGGYGGFDLYVSYFKNGKWTYPDNLGPAINTQGNEITPYFDGETLYFSSDFRMGLGGYDVFSSFVHQGKWQMPANMENGVNSPEDDYYFIKHPFMDSYYLTSNRLGGRGYHDIYLVHKAPDQEMVAESDMTPPAVDLVTDVIDENDWATNTSFVNYTEEEPVAKVVDLDPDNIPEAVNLEAMETAPETKKAADQEEPTSGITVDFVTKDEMESIKKEDKLIDFDKMFPPAAVAIEESESSNASLVSLVGAKRVSFNEVINNVDEGVYFIQLAALFRTKADMSVFNALTKFGNLYKIQS